MIPLVYRELKRLAAYYMAHERPNHTLQATALVHEAYLRLIEQNAVDWQSRAHFFGIAANLMRRILIDHAKGRGAPLGVVDQYPSHEIGGDSEEMRAALPIDGVLLDQPQVRLMDQRSRLKSVIGAFVRHVIGGKPLQFAVDQGNHLVRRSSVSLPHGTKQARNLAGIGLHRFHLEMTRL